MVAAVLGQPECRSGRGRIPAPCNCIFVGGLVGQSGVDHVDHVVAAEDQLGHIARPGVVGVVPAAGFEVHGIGPAHRERVAVGVGQGHGVPLRQGHWGDHDRDELSVFRTVERRGERHGDRLLRGAERPVADIDREVPGDGLAAVGLYDGLADRVVADIHRAEEVRELHAATLVGIEARGGFTGQNRGDGSRLCRRDDGFQGAVFTSDGGVRGPEGHDGRGRVFRCVEREEEERFLRSRQDRCGVYGFRGALVRNEQAGLVVAVPSGQCRRTLVVVVFRQRQGDFRSELPGRIVVVVRTAHGEESRSDAEQQDPEQMEFQVIHRFMHF